MDLLAESQHKYRTVHLTTCFLPVWVVYAYKYTATAKIVDHLSAQMQTNGMCIRILLFSNSCDKYIDHYILQQITYYFS